MNKTPHFYDPDHKLLLQVAVQEWLLPERQLHHRLR